MTATLPDRLDQRPVTIVGSGTLGRRLALMFAAGGSDVRVHDSDEAQREAARKLAASEAGAVAGRLGLSPARTPAVEAVDDLARAVRGAWMVIEAVPERVELKREVFAELDRLADPDAILASNSSSLATSRFVDGVKNRARVLNTHYYQPPEINAVELMSCGETDQRVVDLLMERLPRYGFHPFHVLRESDGFIMNRIWAAIKREALLVLQEGVARPEDVDALWKLCFTDPAIPPFRLMDRVGLDVVLNIEEHYARIREGLPEEPREILRAYIAEGRLGVKSGRGFYDYAG